MKRAIFGITLCFSLLSGSYAQELAQESERPSIADMLEEVMPAVVSVSVRSAAPDAAPNPLLNDPFFRRFFDLPEGQLQPQPPRMGVGSGVIIDAEEGYILTNHHVIEGAEQIEVTLSDRRTVLAERVGSDAGTDIGLLKIEAADLTALSPGDSDSLRVGDFVVAIGNPFAIGQTVTSGIVSALSRGTGIIVDGYEDFIQTDASINPGNSGGALIDYNGTLMGINSAILAPAGGNVGIGFAVPINMAMSVVEQLIEYGEVSRGLLGVSIQDLTPAAADLLGLDTTQGAVVAAVQPDSPAEEAGIEAGDVITGIEGETISGGRELRNAIGLRRPGDEVELTLLGEEGERTLRVTIGGSEQVASAPPAPRAGTDLLEGAILSDGGEGVQVNDVAQGSEAWNNGLRPNDVIVEVNRQPVDTPEDITGVLGESDSTAAALKVRREDRELFLLVG